MILALGVSALVAIALLFDIMVPRTAQAWARHRARRRFAPELSIDPGRDRRAEQTARELLRSCVGEEEWAMYRELGFIRVWGSQAGPRGDSVRGDAARSDAPPRGDGVEYAYLIYPHKPIIAYAPQTGRLVGEYCVEFPDDTRPYGSSRLPDSDDVLAKWMALTGDAQRLLCTANLHLPGRQVDATLVTRDLWRLSRWEQARMRGVASTLGSTSQLRRF